MIELAEMTPPRCNMHPMKGLSIDVCVCFAFTFRLSVLLKIPTLPPPTLENPSAFPKEMSVFLESCLKKSPTLR